MVIKNNEGNIDSLVLECTTDVVAAFLSKNPLPVSELPTVIESVHATLLDLDGSTSGRKQQKLTPPVSIKKSIGRDFLICLEDGQKFKSLKRHLNSRYGMSPDEYRAKWNLPLDYPMVAPGYAEKRSKLAKQMGLGRNRKIQ